MVATHPPIWNMEPGKREEPFDDEHAIPTHWSSLYNLVCLCNKLINIFEFLLQICVQINYVCGQNFIGCYS